MEAAFILATFSLNVAMATSIYNGYRPLDTCINYLKNITLDYRWAVADFVIDTYKANAYITSNNFVYSPLSIWMMLAAVAEGTETEIQQKLFKILHLPDDICARQKYYQLATSRIRPDKAVTVEITKVFGLDSRLRINPGWFTFIWENSLLDLTSLPIKTSKQYVINRIEQLIPAPSNDIDLNGNSVLLNNIGFDGLWTTGFSEVKKEAFYDTEGNHIGLVDMMRTRRYIRMGYTPSVQSKVIELPIGADDRYVALLVIPVPGATVATAIETLTGYFIFEVLESLRPSKIPIEVAIPQLTPSSNINVRRLLENIGVTNIWNDSSVTRYITEPGAMPSSFLERASVRLTTSGVNKPAYVPEASYDAETGLDPRVGRDFIANQPMLWGIFDTEVYSGILASVYSVPTYPLDASSDIS